MKVMQMDAEDFAITLKQIGRGENLDVSDLLGASHYAKDSAHERYQLLKALLRGYAAQQYRIRQKNETIAALERELAKARTV